MSGLSPATRKELASLSPEERAEALRALLATDPAEVIAHAVERDPPAAARGLHAVLPIRADPCVGCRNLLSQVYGSPRLCLRDPFDQGPTVCSACCNDCAKGCDQEPL